MKIAPNVAELQSEHVVWELEGIDRMYLNAVVPHLQSDRAIAHFLRSYLGYPMASTAMLAPMTERFVAEIANFANEMGVDTVAFGKNDDKEAIAKAYLEQFPGQEGVLFIGKAQEKAPVFRTVKRRNPKTGQSYPWVVRQTALINQYYFYCLDRDFGPFFIKFASYFPYNAKLCINGHEYLKRQLHHQGIGYDSLDNGLLSCQDVSRAQRVCDCLDQSKIEALFRKWLAILPHPFSAKDRAAGYCYQLSILQAEFSLTQIWDRPIHGRYFFEEMIRENLDLGRPDQVQLIFGRRVTKRTPGRFRTRVVTKDVTPSLHVYYKKTRIKQYHKQGRALRTETTINDTREFDVGRRLINLPKLRQIGFQANRRLLRVQTLSHNCLLGQEVFERTESPIEVDGQRASALRFGQPRVQAVLSALLLFAFQSSGFRNKQLRPILAQLLDLPESQITQGKMSYELRRLRLHGLIRRIPKTHQYQLTEEGLRIALFYTRLHARAFRSGLSQIFDNLKATASPWLQKAFSKIDDAIDAHCAAFNLT